MRIRLRSQFPSLNSEVSIFFDSNLNNNYVGSFHANMCSCMLVVNSFTVSLTFTVNSFTVSLTFIVTPFTLKVQVVALR